MTRGRLADEIKTHRQLLGHRCVFLVLFNLAPGSPLLPDHHFSQIVAERNPGLAGRAGEALAIEGNRAEVLRAAIQFTFELCRGQEALRADDLGSQTSRGRSGHAGTGSPAIESVRAIDERGREDHVEHPARTSNTSDRAGRIAFSGAEQVEVATGGGEVGIADTPVALRTPQLL